MRYRTRKTRSYTSKRKDTKVTNKNSADAFENEPQPTQHNAAYKMTNINVVEWYEDLNRDPNKSCRNNNIFNETIPSQNLTHCITTLYHTTSTLLIQGSQRAVWVKKEFPILKAALNHHRNHDTNKINDACNYILEIPEENLSTEQQLTGEPEETSTSTDTLIIPENETKENTSPTQTQTKNTPSTSLETLANPTIMITPLVADIALTIPK